VKKSESYYEITDLGQQYLAGEITAEVLEEKSPDD
jgi:hypothetical protein